MAEDSTSVNLNRARQAVPIGSFDSLAFRQAAKLMRLKFAAIVGLSARDYASSEGISNLTKSAWKPLVFTAP
jgi:hypothetical protein